MNAFGTVAIEKGVNIWMLKKVKKKDSVRKFVSIMFGVILADYHSASFLMPVTLDRSTRTLSKSQL